MTQNAVIQLFFALGVILIAAKSAGFISRVVGQPAVLGKLLVGILLGPSLLNMLGWPIFTDTHLSETIQQIAELGVLFLMFGAGLDVRLSELRHLGRISLYSGSLGVLVPVLLTIPVALLASHTLEQSLFLGITLSATSVSISAQTMLELGVLKSKEGVALLGAAVIDDILAIVLLSVLIAISVTGGGLGEVLAVIGRLVLFVVLATGIAWTVLPRLANWVANLPISSGVLALAASAAMLWGWGAEALGGMAAISGAFIAGVCLGRASRETRHQIEHGLYSLNYGLLVPIFFVSIGLKADLREFTFASFPFALVLLATAVGSKIIGSGAGARWGGFDNRSALRVGVGMISRGEVGLIIGTVGLQSGLIPPPTFLVVVLIIVLTTVITPPLVRWIFRKSAPGSAVPVTVGEE